MNLVKNAATYRGGVVSHAVSETRNGFPQWVAELSVVEIWDDDDKVWVDWSKYGLSIVAYNTLFGSKGETLTCTQVKKTVGWDGLSFQGLNDMDLSEVQIQFRVEESTYEEKTSLKVEWIDTYDAVPGTAIKTLNPDEMKQLDAKYKQFMTKSKPATAPASAPASAPAGKPSSPGKVNAKGVKATQKKGPVTKTTKAPATAPAPPSAPPTAGAPLTPLTKKEAWESVVAKRANADDDQLGQAWLEAIATIGKGNDQTLLTEDDWAVVELEVLGKVLKF